MARPRPAVDYDGEISSCDKMIAKYRAKKQRFIEAKLRDENERIISLVRGKKLSLDELNSAMDEFICGKKSREEAVGADGQSEEKTTGETPVIKKEEKINEEVL